MLRMNSAEARLRRGSQFLLRRYRYDAQWKLSIGVERVRLLAVVGCIRESRVDAVERVRVQLLLSGELVDVDPHFLIDPTRG